VRATFFCKKKKKKSFSERIQKAKTTMMTSLSKF